MGPLLGFDTRYLRAIEGLVKAPARIANGDYLCWSMAGRTTMAKGTLIAAMKIGRAAEDEFNDWYDTEHLPERQRAPGFLVCQRWIGTEDRTVSVATYDLADVGVLKTPAYLAIGGENLSPWSKRVTARVDRLMRFEGDQTLPGDQLPPDTAGGLLLNAMNIAPD